jgi:hypothetical protein
VALNCLFTDGPKPFFLLCRKDDEDNFDDENDHCCEQRHVKRFEQFREFLLTDCLSNVLEGTKLDKGERDKTDEAEDRELREKGTYLGTQGMRQAGRGSRGGGYLPSAPCANALPYGRAIPAWRKGTGQCTWVQGVAAYSRVAFKVSKATVTTIKKVREKNMTVVVFEGSSSGSSGS